MDTIIKQLEDSKIEYTHLFNLKAEVEAKNDLLTKQVNELTQLGADKDTKIKSLEASVGELEKKLADAEGKLKLTVAFGHISEGAEPVKTNHSEGKSSIVKQYMALQGLERQEFYAKHKNEILKELR